MKNSTSLLRPLPLACGLVAAGTALAWRPPSGDVDRTASTAAGPHQGAPRPLRLNRLPQLTTDFVDGTVVIAGEELVFHVTVRDLDGDLVSLMLLNPPPGARFTPVVAGAGPVTREVRWDTTTPLGGLHHLVFEARDHSPFQGRRRLTLTVRVEGLVEPTSILTGDVTGDGELDLVTRAPLANVQGVVDVGAIYVWKGRTTPGDHPDARLTYAGALPSDQLSVTSSSGLQLADVTGDGVLDVVACSSDADQGAKLDVGSLHVWIGGAGLTGNVEPSASLALPPLHEYHSLGETHGQGLSIYDVTGDGILDVLAAGPGTYSGFGGVIYVLAGGPGLSGATAPTATLERPGRQSSWVAESLWQGLRVVDFTGDGVLDVVAAAYRGDLSNKGVLYLWEGGPTLVGSQTPAVFREDDTPSSTLGQDQYRFADVTGDGHVDLIASVPRKQEGGVYVGAVHVWAGGPGWSAGTPTATLTVADTGHAQLGSSVVLADVTGDGTLDVIATAPGATVGGTSLAGAVHVWAGGSGLSGTPAPLATLTRADPEAGDEFGKDFYLNRPVLVAELTGDGFPDVAVVATEATFPSVPGETGGVFVFEAGPGLSGPTVPWASLRPQPADGVTSVALGSIDRPRQGVLIEDVTGDGRDDLIVGDARAAVGGVLDAGAVYVWEGGTALAGTPTPRATLTIAAPSTNDRLGAVSGQGLKVDDVTGDGIADVVAGSESAPLAGLMRIGGLYVWEGGAILTGARTPSSELRTATAVRDDYLCNSTGEGFLLVELNGDGVLDVLAGSMSSNVLGEDLAGSAFLWPGGPGLAASGATITPIAIHRTAPLERDRLGRTTGHALHLIDLDLDGVLDLVYPGAEATVGTKAFQGTMLFQSGPLDASGAVVRELSAQGSHAGAQLTL